MKDAENIFFFLNIKWLSCIQLLHFLSIQKKTLFLDRNFDNTYIKMSAVLKTGWTFCISFSTIQIRAAAWQNQQNYMCAQVRQISLGIHLVWSELSLSACSLATHKVHSEDTDQTGRLHRLIWVFAGRTSHFVGFVVRQLIILSSPPLFLSYELPLSVLSTCFSFLRVNQLPYPNRVHRVNHSIVSYG